VRQWQRELIDKTTLPEDAIAEYSGESKQTAPVTLATYKFSATALVKTVNFRISNCSALAHGA
jgi:DNA excision repair protein ERCC-3